MSEKYSTRDIAISGVFIAVYVVLTMINPLSFGAVQFRTAAIISVLPLFVKKLKIAGVLGVAIANLWSPFGFIDVVFGCSIWLITYYLLDRIPVSRYIIAVLSGIVAALLVAAEILIVAGGKYLPLFIGILIPQEIAMLLGCFIFSKMRNIIEKW